MQHLKKFFVVVLTCLFVIPNMVTPAFAFFETIRTEPVKGRVTYYDSTNNRNKYYILANNRMDGHYAFARDNLGRAYFFATDGSGNGVPFRISEDYQTSIGNSTSTANSNVGFTDLTINYSAILNYNYEFINADIDFNLMLNTNRIYYDNPIVKEVFNYIDGLDGDFSNITDLNKPPEPEVYQANGCWYSYKNKYDQLTVTSSSIQVSRESSSQTITRSYLLPSWKTSFPDVPEDITNWFPPLDVVNVVIDSLENTLSNSYNFIRDLTSHDIESSNVSTENITINQGTANEKEVNLITCYDYDSSSYLPTGIVKINDNGNGSSDIVNITYDIPVYDTDGNNMIITVDQTINNSTINNNDIYNDYSVTNQNFSDVVNNYNNIENNYVDQMNEQMKDINIDIGNIDIPSSGIGSFTLMGTMMGSFLGVFDGYEWFFTICLILFLISLILSRKDK